MIVFLWAIAAAMGLIVLVAIIAFVVAVKMGLLDDPDGKESNPDYAKIMQRSAYLQSMEAEQRKGRK